jgi:hypothetical protein
MLGQLPRRLGIDLAVDLHGAQHEDEGGVGLAKARLQHVATAAAINVYRISD